MNPLSTNPWDVRDTDYPLKADVAEKWRFLLKYAVLAPSGPRLFGLHLPGRLPPKLQVLLQFLREHLSPGLPGGARPHP